MHNALEKPTKERYIKRLIGYQKQGLVMKQRLLACTLLTDI